MWCQYTLRVPGESDPTPRLAALYHLVCDRQLSPDAPPPGEPDEAFITAQLERVSADRFLAVEAFLSSQTDVAASQVDALALRLLLEDYVIAVDRLRAVAQVTGRALDRVGSAIKQSQRAQQRMTAEVANTTSAPAQPQ